MIISIYNHKNSFYKLFKIETLKSNLDDIKSVVLYNIDSIIWTTVCGPLQCKPQLVRVLVYIFAICAEKMSRQTHLERLFDRLSHRLHVCFLRDTCSCRYSIAGGTWSSCLHFLSLASYRPKTEWPYSSLATASWLQAGRRLCRAVLWTFSKVSRLYRRTKRFSRELLG